MDNLKSKVVCGAGWVLMQRFSTQIVSFLVTLVLARLLSPGDYGTVALLSVFISVAGIIVDSGMGMALIQKKDATDLDFNTLFYASIVLSVFVYLCLYCVAPVIARFYQLSELTWMLRLVAVSLIFNAVNSVQSAELSRKLLFRLSFRISIVTSVASALSGITLACLGFGAWALAWQGVIAGATGVVANWFIVAWRPRLMFSFHALKQLYDFGWKVSLVGLINAVYTNAYSLIIGKVYTKESLAFVNKGRAVPTLASETISSAICRVSFPVLSQMQDNISRMRAIFRRMLLCSTYIVFPLMLGLAICAPDIVIVLFGEKWLPCAPYMRLVCFSLALQPFHDINLQTIAALGKGNVFLRLQIIKTGLGCLLMVLFLRQSVLSFMTALAFVSGPVGVIVNSYYNRRFVGYSCVAQIKDVMPTAFCCLIMGGVIFPLGFIGKGSGTIGYALLRIALQSSVGIMVYFVISYHTKNRGMSEYLSVMMPRISRVSPSIARRLSSRFVQGSGL